MALVFAAACAVCEKPKAQIDSIFRYSPSQRVFKLYNFAELQLFFFDSARANNILDTLVALADGKDRRLAWYGRYYKLKYKARSFGKEQEIAYFYSLQSWADNCPEEIIKAVYKYDLGMLLYKNSQYAEGLNQVLQALHIFETIGFDNVPEIASYLYELANCYYDLGDYKKTIIYVQLADKYPVGHHGVNISRFNTEGLAFRQLKDYTNAEKCFLRARDSAVASGDSIWAGIASGNYGRTLVLAGDYNNAIPDLLRDYILNKDINHYDAAMAACDVAWCYTKTGRLREALPYFQLARWLAGKATPDEYNTRFYRPYYQHIAKYYAAAGDMRDAALNGDSLVRFSDSLSLVSSESLLTSTEVRVKTESYLASQAAADESKKNALVIRNTAGISIATVISVLLALVFTRYRVAVRKHSLLHAQKNLVEEKLRHAEVQLNTYIRKITEKNELVERANGELERLKGNAGYGVSTEKLEALSALFKSNILTDEDWGTFTELFDVAHPGFFSGLANQFPFLTPAEVKLFALMKLNLSNKEIAAMTSVAPESVTKTKQRLRKKLADMQVDEELETLVGRL